MQGQTQVMPTANSCPWGQRMQVPGRGLPEGTRGRGWGKQSKGESQPQAGNCTQDQGVEVALFPTPTQHTPEKTAWMEKAHTGIGRPQLSLADLRSRLHSPAPPRLVAGTQATWLPALTC